MDIQFVLDGAKIDLKLESIFKIFQFSTLISNLKALA